MAIERVNPRGSLWKERARALQLQIRNRFRVAVDRRHRWTEESDYSSTFQRWILRARTLLGDSPSSQAPNSLMFYRKRVDKAVSAIDDSTIIRFLQALAVPVIGNACHMFMHGLNNIQIYGAEKLHQALLQRPQGKSLITVSNHVAAVDDPLVIASLLPPSVISDARNLRWTLCATDRCFSNPVLSAFFRCVKVLPVSRGDGIYQKGMDMALSKLNDGGWVHIFPEGSRSRDGGRTMGSPKRGVGRLVMDADSIPVVVPFVHSGMQEVMPVGSKLPKMGKKVTVLVGDPIYLDDLVVDDAQDVSRGLLYDAVSSRIGHSLRELKVQVDRLVALEPPPEAQSHTTESGYGIWQHVDWEAFGIENLILGEDFEAKQGGDGAEPTVSQLQRPDSRNRNIGMSSLFQGGIVSRIRGHMNPTELMGFAARGLFMNDRVSDWSSLNFEEGSSLKIWRHFFGETVFHQWS